jgi:CRP-like cAMP-binding protein
MPREKTDKLSGNRLLAALEPDDAARLRPDLEETSLKRQQVLYEPHGAIALAYFPHDGLISLQTVLSNGPSVESGMIGREGMLGLPLVGDHNNSPTRAVVQVPGHAAVIAADRLQRALRDSAPMRSLFGRYLHAFLTQITQSSACNAVHAAERRLARWLLGATERNSGKALPLTHEFLADLLGVGRPTLTLVARALQNAGLIEYRRGLITVTDRDGLEAAACECYRAVRRVYEDLLPLTFG